MSGVRKWNNPNRSQKVTISKPNKKVTKKEVKQIARNVVRSIDEIKQVQGFVASGNLTLGAIVYAVNANGIGVSATGAKDSSRIGNRIRLTRIEIRIWLYSNVVVGENLSLRVGLFKTEDTKWGDPSASGHPLGATTLTNTPLVDTYSKRMYDKTLLFGLAPEASTDRFKFITISRKLNNVLGYSGELANQYSQGTFPAFYMKLYGNNGGLPLLGNNIQYSIEGSLYFKEM